MRGVLILSAAMVAGVLAEAAAQDDFNWRGRIAAGKELVVRGVNGDVNVIAARGSEAVVNATKRAEDDDPDEVTIEVVEEGGNVTICAIYPMPARRRSSRDRRDAGPNECLPGGGGRNHVQNNDVRVTFTVEVPAGVRILAKTVNGDVNIASVDGDAVAETVNGSVDLVTRGRGEATTVNGSIVATVGRTDWTETAHFTTVNGGITLTVPSTLNVDITAKTVNGDIETDFPLVVQGRFGPRRITGKIGNGGTPLILETVNGSIELRRR